MSDIFDEKNMIRSLEQYIPSGETLTAGVHGVGIETEIKQAFGKCVFDGEQLIPNENGGGIEVSKSKYARYDVYIGITQHYLILTECEACSHRYEFNDTPDLKGTAVTEIDTCMSLEEIGHCFPLAEIQNCVTKKIWMGAVNCFITMKNGSILKIMLPKRGGLGGGMPHHAEYREAIIARLSSNKNVV